MKIDKTFQDVIRQEIDRLKKENAEIRKQMEHEMNRNSIHIYALEELLKQSE